VIAQIAPYLRYIEDRFYAQSLKQGAGPDAGALQEAGGVDAACTQDGIAIGANHVLSPIMTNFYARYPASFQNESDDLGIGHDI
jgi:hypothetical protein